MKISNSSKILISFFVMAMILLSGHAAQSIFSWITFLELLVGAVSIFLLLFTTEKLENSGDTYLFLLLLIMVVCTVITQFFAGFFSYASFFSYIVAGYIIAKLYSFEDFVRCFRSVMTITTIIALFGYVLLQFTKVLEILPAYKNVNEIEYGFSFIYNYIKNVPDRNCGMFWEPGLLATYLSFAMIVELLFVEKADWKRLTLYSVAMFTANSSAGFALWFFCILLLVVRNNRTTEMNLLRSAVSLVAVIIAIVVIYNFDNILAETQLGDNEYFLKLSTDSVTNSSRMAAVEHNLEVFSEAPLFGTGFVKVAAQLENIEDTSTSTYLMSVFGLLGAVYTIAWAIGIFKIKDLNFLSKIVLLVIVMIILNKEPHHRQLFTWCLLFYMIGGKMQKKGSLSHADQQVTLKNEGYHGNQTAS